MRRQACRKPVRALWTNQPETAGLNRSTILRAIKSGKISGARDETGVWSVEPVELHRVFPPASAPPKAAPQDAQTDALVAELRAQLADMRAQRDAWQGIAERLALSAPKPTEPKLDEEAKATHGSLRHPWWRRLVG